MFFLYGTHPDLELLLKCKLLCKTESSRNSNSKNFVAAIA